MGRRKPADVFIESATGNALRFDRGITLGGRDASTWDGQPRHSSVEPTSDDGADLWIVDPSEFDEKRRIVVADPRTLRHPDFSVWLSCDARMPQDDAPDLVVYVPERGPGRTDAARMLDGAELALEVISYQPPAVW